MVERKIIKLEETEVFSCLTRRLYLEAIFDSISNGIFSVDNEFKITSFNKAAEEITGFTRGKAIGCSYKDIIREKSSGRGIVTKVIEDEEGIEDVEITLVSKEGAEKKVILTTTLLKDQKSIRVGAVAVLWDISEIEKLKEELKGRYKFHNIIGKNYKMQEIYRLIEQVAESNASVVIEGESGTGKELVAHAIHYMSLRADRPFITVNCAALPETLLESELFGHVKGAFTGAIRDRIGRFEAGHEGTIFLDEIGELSLLIQLKLLRVIQDKEFERVGDTKTLKVDVRIIAATNKDLKERILQGLFREDLYYRLKVVAISLPPLRDRKDDIPMLVNYFIDKFRKETGKEITGITKDATAALIDYDWPGNIRELENAIEFTFIKCKARKISLYDFPEEVISKAPLLVRNKKKVMKTPALEKAMLIQVLEESKWNKSKAARVLGIGRSTLWRKIKEYRLDETG